MNNEAENLLLEKARAAFRESVTVLDAGTLARLRAARERALAQVRRPATFWRRPVWRVPLSAAAIVLAAVAGALLWWNLDSQPGMPFAVSNGEDMAIVLSNDNLDMYADMDFYRWLQAQQQQSAPSQTDSRGNNNG
jgi:ferric-dicitrate binding protein FerR (iron transport regulator)